METKAFKHQYAMIIDDEELDNFLNEKLMVFNHFSKHIYKHNSAVSALAFLNELKTKGPEALSAFPEVIFIDLNMPVVDGFQFIESLNKLVAQLKIQTQLVVLTSSVAQKDRDKISEINPDYLFVTKPLSSEWLQAN